MKTIAYSMGERVVLQITSLSSVIIYALSMSASDFGLLYFLVAVGNVLGVLILSGNEQTIMNEIACEEESINVFNRRLCNYILLTCLLVPIFFIFKLNFSYYTLFILLIPYVFQVFEIQAKHAMEFEKIFFARILVLLSITPVKAYSWYIGLDNYYYYSVLLVLDVVLPYTLLMNRRMIGNMTRVSTNSIVRYFEYLKISLSRMGASILVIGFSRADVMLSKLLFGNEISALFSVLQRFMAPMGLVVSAINSYFYPKVSKARTEKRMEIDARLTRNMFFISTFLVVIIAVFIYLFSNLILPRIQLDIVVDLEILTLYLVASVFGCIAAMVSFRYNLEGKYISRLIRASVTLVFMLLGTYFLSGMYGYLGIAYSYLLAQIGSATIFNWVGPQGLTVWLRSLGWKSK